MEHLISKLLEKRCLIILGPPRSGKTTLARNIADTFEVRQVEHMDHGARSRTVPFSLARRCRPVRLVVLEGVNSFREMTDFMDAVTKFSRAETSPKIIFTAFTLSEDDRQKALASEHFQVVALGTPIPL